MYIQSNLKQDNSVNHLSRKRHQNSKHHGTGIRVSKWFDRKRLE